MLRRQLVLVLAAALGITAMRSRAQSAVPVVKRVGVLAQGTRATAQPVVQPFWDEMTRLGWVEGQNVFYDWSTAEGQPALLPQRAAELVARKPDLILTGTLILALAARRATTTIPIVFANVGDPVELGLVNSLSHPGGNLTGVSGIWESLVPKRLQLPHEIMPRVKRVGIFVDPLDPMRGRDLAALAPVAQALGLVIVPVDVSNAGDVEGAVATLLNARVDAIPAQVSSAALVTSRNRLMELANRAKVPVISGTAFSVEAGGLFAYGGSLAAQYRREAQLADKILRGAKPADIPVEQITEIEFTVNLKAAKLMGISIAPSVLLRADRMIE